MAPGLTKDTKEQSGRKNKDLVILHLGFVSEHFLYPLKKKWRTYKIQFSQATVPCCKTWPHHLPSIK